MNCAVGTGGSMPRGCSLRELVEEHGFGIHVQSTDTDCKSFTVVSEDNKFKYNIKYDDGRISSVLKECPNTNDYYLAPDIKGVKMISPSDMNVPVRNWMVEKYIAHIDGRLEPQVGMDPPYKIATNLQFGGSLIRDCEVREARRRYDEIGWNVDWDHENKMLIFTIPEGAIDEN